MASVRFASTSQVVRFDFEMPAAKLLNPGEHLKVKRLGPQQKSILKETSFTKFFSDSEMKRFMRLRLDNTQSAPRDHALFVKQYRETMRDYNYTQMYLQRLKLEGSDHMERHLMVVHKRSHQFWRDYDRKFKNTKWEIK